MKKMMKKIKRALTTQAVLTGLIFFSLMNFACDNRSFEKANISESSAAPEQTLSNFASDLQTMKTANFEYIFVFRRKDGGAFDGEDKKYLRANAPAETNRFVSTDNGKAFIAGSKFKFPLQNLETLRTRFNIEDYSAVKEEGK
jgi:hypothetical protein